MGQTLSVNKTELVGSATAYPCGLIAKSVFTDEYELFSDQLMFQPIEINSTNIAWKSDVDYKFKN